MEPKKLLVRICTSTSVWTVRESIEINIDEYGELKGKSDDEIKDYISNHAWEMKAPSEFASIYDSLGECLDDRDVIRDKETGSETHIYFE